MEFKYENVKHYDHVCLEGPLSQVNDIGAKGRATDQERIQISVYKI